MIIFEKIMKLQTIHIVVEFCTNAGF